MGMGDVAELVEDEVVDAGGGGLNEAGVEQDAPGTGVAAPAGGHGAQLTLGSRDAVAPHLGGAMSIALGQAQPGVVGVPSLHKAAGVGEPVSQDIAVTVKGDKVECAVNGTTVASFNKSEVVGAGKLKSTDGVWGIRFAHNTEATVTNLMVMKP